MEVILSFLLANFCQLSDRIAAIASVTGSMTPQTYNVIDGIWSYVIL